MDSYFKAAVSDLDKLLDELEQNTDELEDSSLVNQVDSKHHLLSSDLDYQHPKFLEPNVQEHSSGCTMVDELSLSTQNANASPLEQLNSEQNEKNVTGLDLLSMVDSGSSDENKTSCLGRCSIPVCDLISDTGNLSYVKSNSKCVQKLQPGDLQCSMNSQIGFDLALLPATACSQSVHCNTNSGTQQKMDGDTVLYNIEYSAAEEQSQLALKMGSLSESNVVNLGSNQEKTATLNNNDVSDRIEQTVDPDRISVLTPLIPNVHSSKDDTICEKLSCEPLVDENTHCETQIIDGENGKQAISKEDSIESVAIHLPKTYELNKNCVSDSLQTADMQVLDKIHSTEKNLRSLEQNTNTNVNIVSTPEVTEDTQTSLSCLPLAVSICRSLVTTEETHNNIPQNEAVDVISDLTMHTDKHNPGLPKRELHENAEYSKEEENQTSQCLEKPSFTDEEKVDFENIASKCELLQHQDTAIFSGSLEADTEMCSRILPTDPSGRISVGSAVEEEISSDILISDAELDAFLSEHCLEASDSKPLKEDTDDGLLESDVIQDANKLNVQSDGSQAENEFKMEASVDKLSCVVPNSEPKLRILVEKSTQQAHQETSDHISGTQSDFSDLINSQHVVHSGGARPKQLPNLPPKAKICSEFKSPNTHGSEPQMINSITLNTSRLNTKICPDSSLGYNYADTQSCLKEKGGSEFAEPSKVVEEVIVLGQKQPSWVPDSEAPHCMNCQAKFTFTKRRHHCRACGKVFCAPCCNRKCKLQYLDKEARVCVSCYESINKAQAFERMMSPTGPVPDSDVSEYCSAVPPLHETQTSGTPNSPVLFPSSVFKQPNGDGLCTKEQRRVWFADGILPNGEVADTTKLSSGVRRSPQELYPAETPSDTTSTTDVKPKDEMHFGGQTETLNFPASVLPEEDALPTKGQLELLCNFDTTSPVDDEFSGVVEPTKPLDPAVANETNDVPSDVSTVDYYGMLCGIEKYVGKDISFIPEDDGLPPLLVLRGEKGEGEESLVEEHPSYKQITLMLESNTLTFVLNANLLVNVKILSYGSERCWYFSTNGLHGLGQAEIIILLLCLPDEEEIPKEIFKLFIDIYKDAMKGKFIGNLENITFTESFLGSKEHGGFLFVTPTFQKLDDLTLPQNPYLCGILIQKQEVPWAKVFPIRLILRLGAEYAAYPTPLTSIRHRKPLFGEIGHTVMNLLVDLRNYQYTLHTIGNLFIHMEMGRSCIKIPLRKYNEVMKVVNTSNEHVISIGASFSTEADSHLVCVQNDDGVYQTQANSATGHPRKITGASFVVFNGALKTSSGFLAKSSIVEDGIMVQITPETMDGLRQALREKKNFRIACGKVDSGDLREYVDICWEENEEKTNVGVRSPIDGKSMEGVESEKIIQEHQFEMDEKLVKCTEVFYLLKPSDVYGHSPYEFAKDIALASCAAFRHHLKTLKSNGMNKIGLRVSVDTDMVEYQAGSGGQLLPQHYLNDLDSALIPVIHGGTSNATNLPLEMELIFFITESLLM